MMKTTPMTKLMNKKLSLLPLVHLAALAACLALPGAQAQESNNAPRLVPAVRVAHAGTASLLGATRAGDRLVDDGVMAACGGGVCAEQRCGGTEQDQAENGVDLDLDGDIDESCGEGGLAR